jgi:hypothetical protein
MWFSAMVAKNYGVEKVTSSTNGVRETGYPHVEDWNRSLSLILYKIQFKMDQRS